MTEAHHYSVSLQKVTLALDEPTKSFAEPAAGALLDDSTRQADTRLEVFRLQVVLGGGARARVHQHIYARTHGHAHMRARASLCKHMCNTSK